MLPPPNSFWGQDHWLPKLFGEGNFVDRKLFLPASLLVAIEWPKGKDSKGQRAARFISWSFESTTHLCRFKNAALQFASPNNTECHAVLQNEPDTNSETSSKLHAMSEAGILRPSVSFAPIPCSTARATWSASSCGAVANWRSGKGCPYNDRHYGVLILEFQDPITNKLADNMVSDW